MATYAFKTRQYGPSATGSILTYQDLDYSLLFLSASILQKTGSLQVLGSIESSEQLVVGTGLSVGGTTNLIDLNAGATVLSGNEQSIPLIVYDGVLDVNAFVVDTTTSTIELGNSGGPYITNVNDKLQVTGTATVAGNLHATTNAVVTGSIINTAIVSASIAVIGSSTSQTFTTTLTKIDGTALSNKRQLVHWWTSTSQYGVASNVLNGTYPTYTITSGTQIVASTSGSMNHSVTDTNGQLVLSLTTERSITPLPVWFHVEVQGVVASISAQMATAN